MTVISLLSGIYLKGATLHSARRYLCRPHRDHYSFLSSTVEKIKLRVLSNFKNLPKYKYIFVIYFKNYSPKDLKEL